MTSGLLLQLRCNIFLGDPSAQIATLNNKPCSLEPSSSAGHEGSCPVRRIPCLKHFKHQLQVNAEIADGQQTEH